MEKAIEQSQQQCQRTCMMYVMTNVPQCARKGEITDLSVDNSFLSREGRRVSGWLPPARNSFSSVGRVRCLYQLDTNHGSIDPSIGIKS